MLNKKILIGIISSSIIFQITTITSFADTNKNLKNNEIINSADNVSISKITDRKIDVRYSFLNKYGEKIKLFLEDWALYPKNHKEYLGDVDAGKEYELNKTFNIVPSFEADGNLSPETDNPLKYNLDPDTIYISKKIVGFAPTFYVKDINGLLLSTSNPTTSIDMGKLVLDMQGLSKNIKIKAIVPNKKVKVNDTIDIEFELTNSSDKAFEVKVEDGIYFGTEKICDLGKVLPGKVTKFKKTIKVTPELINSDSKLKLGLPAFHFYNGDTELFVQKTNIEYSNSSPVIKGLKDVTIYKGEKFNPLEGVTAYDLEDGNLTDKIKITGLDTLDTIGKHELTYTVTDADKNTTTEKRKINVVPLSNLFKSNIKLVYFRNYGVIIEGDVKNDFNEKFKKDMKKKLLIKHGGKTNEIELLNTDWYEKDNFSGYQAILTSKNLSSIGNVKNAELYIQLEFKNQLVEIPIVNDKKIKYKNTRSWASDYFYDINTSPQIEIGDNKVKIRISNKGNVVITNKLLNGSLNMLAYYMDSNKSYVYNGALDPNLVDEKYKKTFEVKDKEGQVVYTGKVVTFAEDIYPEVSKGAAIQIIVPREFSTNEYTVSIIVKDDTDNDKYEFIIPKYFN